MSIQRVGIVGAGNVGVAAAFALFVQKNCSEIVLVDLDKTRTRGEAMDLMHGQPYVGRIVVQAGEYEDLAGCQIVVVTAGASQKPGESRLDLLNRNASIFRSIAKGLDEYAPDATVIVASNPVDILTFIMQKLTARPHHRVIGTGTMLDTSRFRSLLGEYYDVSPRSVHGYILGEHGDSEFPAWSTLTIGGKSPFRSTILGRQWNDDDMNDLVSRVRNSAYEIINAKGYTNWGIGLVISTLVGIVLDNRRVIEPVSSLLTGEYGLSDVCLSVPTLVGGDGVHRRVRLNLEEGEQSSLEKSAALLKDLIARVEI